jgi:hypothetical protein
MKYQAGSSKDFTLGTKTSAQIAENNVNLLGRFSLAALGDLSVGLFSTKRFTLKTDQTYTTGHKLSSASQQTMTGVAGVNISCKPNISMAAAVGSAVGFGGVTGAVAGKMAVVRIAKAAVATGNAVKNIVSGVDQSAEDKSAEAALNSVSTSAIDVAKTALGLLMDGHEIAQKATPSLTELSLTPEKARLGIGPGLLPSTPATPGIDITQAGITIGFGPTSNITITQAGITINSPQIKVIGGPISGISLISAGFCGIKAGVEGVDIKAVGGLVNVEGVQVNFTGATGSTLS